MSVSNISFPTELLGVPWPVWTVMAWAVFMITTCFVVAEFGRCEHGARGGCDYDRDQRPGAE